MSRYAVISNLRQFKPATISANTNFAAVAIVLAARDDENEILLVRRSRHPADPWSGQVGLPGGRHEPSDKALIDTAKRETLEETGIDLGTSSLALPLDDQQGYARGGRIDLTVRPFVFILEGRPAVRLNYELDAFFWLPINCFAEQARHIRFTPMKDWPDRPGLRIDDDNTLWGITYRIMTGFFDAAGIDTPFVCDSLRSR